MSDHSRPTPAVEIHPRGFRANVARSLRKYVNGYGRARRREYWWFALFQILAVAVPYAIAVAFDYALDDETQGGLSSLLVGLPVVIGLLAYIGLILPGLAVLIRRFHDVGLTGWLVLVNLIPGLGSLFTLVVCLIPSQSRANTHGPIPANARNLAETFA